MKSIDQIGDPQQHGDMLPLGSDPQRFEHDQHAVRLDERGAGVFRKLEERHLYISKSLSL